MNRAGGWLAVLVALALAGSAVLQAQAPAVARIHVVVPEAGSIEFGRPFALEVHRTVPRAATAEPFDPTSLAPAVLEPAAPGPASVTATARHETLRFTARVFASGAVALPAPELRLRGAGVVVDTVRGEPVPLAVASLLQGPPGDFEWAGDVRDAAVGAPSPWWLAGSLLAGLVAFAVRAARRRPAAAPVAVPAPPPERVLEELGALALPRDGDPVSATAFHVALAAIVRGYAARRWQVPALVRTTEELLRAAPAGRPALLECLSACDLVKFAAARPGPAASAAAHAAAVRFVNATLPATGDAP